MPADFLRQSLLALAEGREDLPPSLDDLIARYNAAHCRELLGDRGPKIVLAYLKELGEKSLPADTVS